MKQKLSEILTFFLKSYIINQTIDYNTGYVHPQRVQKNVPYAEPKELYSHKEGYIFAGWFIGEKGYDFTKPVTGDITLAAKWLKEGENAVSITPQKVYVTTGDIEGKLYIAAYKDGRLTAIKALDSKPGFAWELSKLGPDVSAADKLAAFLWDSKMIPLCKSANTLME